MLNIDSVLDSLTHRIWLYCQHFCGLWRSSGCVFYLYVYILCIDFLQSIDYFISTILSDGKIKSLKKQFRGLHYGQLDQSGVCLSYTIGYSVDCMCVLTNIGCIRKYTEQQFYTSWFIIWRVCNAILFLSCCFVLKC